MRSGYRTTQLQGITDLTVLADVKPGFVDGTFEVDTQAERLDRVLRVINGVRQASREAALQPNPFADLVGRFRSIHFFRFGIVTPDRIDGKHWKLLLNVTFDGGWEPYMRIIWKPLGTLLDLIYCHCKDYPLAYRSSYEDYIAWVRRHEIQSSFFYADSGITVADQQYLAALQAAQRDDGGLREGDACLASFALPGRPPAVVPTPGAAALAVRALKAVAGLRPLFADVTDQHGVQQSGLLLRFAHDFFADLRGWVADGLFDPGQPLDHLRPLFEDERAWLMKARDRPPQKTDRPALRPSGAQAGITASLPDKILHGAVVLLRVTDPAKVPAWLPSAATAADAPPPDAIYRNLAITYRGLRVLGVPPQRLERLPREFIDGMELRAGTMGDLRGNHPQWWKRPRRNWPTNLDPSLRLSLELSTLHLVVQLRTEAQVGDKMVDVDGCELVDRLHTAITALDGAQGVQVLHVQPMRRSGTGAAPRDHFGFADGISQPALHNGVASGSYWDDRVKTGELLLGYVNERGDGPEGAATPLDLLLDNGSYLVVRKLRQDKLLFEALVADQAQRMAGGNAGLVPALEEEVKSKLLGRRSDGTPLVQVRGAGANDFDYRHDTQGLQCPFQSHVRRANPREREPLLAMPRIARRGMSYQKSSDGGASEYGLMFMAYNASIADQFEVIQRWLAGGNSTGIGAAQDDPLLGVPRTGERRCFHYQRDDGQGVRVDLGDKPLVELQWGLYAFAPSIAALRAWSQAIASPPPQLAGEGGGEGVRTRAPPPSFDPPKDNKGWRIALDDANVRERTWQWVRDQPSPVVAEGYGTLFGKRADVLQALQAKNGATYSVCGYGERMQRSIGLGFLGQDDPAHALVADRVNPLIEAYTEPIAFEGAWNAATLELDKVKKMAKATGGVAPVSFVELGNKVIATLCQQWFGLPDGVLMQAGGVDDDPKGTTVKCPGHLLTASRFVFAPHPSPKIESLGSAQGQAVYDRVFKRLDRKEPLVGLSRDIFDALGGSAGERGLQARTIAGVMLGFPATTLGNLSSVLVAWHETRRLWDLQLALREARGTAPMTHALAHANLHDTLLETMRQRPVPFAVWRTKAGACGRPDAADADRVVLGLGSAMQDEANSLLMFGGARPKDNQPALQAPHACPGREMAMGTMLGAIAALLDAGELRPSDDARVVVLRAA